MIMLAMFLGLAGSHDIARLVLAIEMAENTPWHAEGGGLQFTERAWREETKQPYSMAKRADVAREVAAIRLARYARKLHALGIEPTPALLGCIWNKGWSGALKLRRENQCCDYGHRVSNLFHAYTK